MRYEGTIQEAETQHKSARARARERERERCSFSLSLSRVEIDFPPPYPPGLVRAVRQYQRRELLISLYPPLSSTPTFMGFSRKRKEKKRIEKKKKE